MVSVIVYECFFSRHFRNLKLFRHYSSFCFSTISDLGLNGRVRYYLDTDTEDFRLNPETGLLVVSKMLDRETKEYYDLTVRAVDGSKESPLSSFAVVRVRVLDVNDVTPEFSSKIYTVKAREDLPVGTVVGMVHATDPDLYQVLLVVSCH